MVLVMRLQWKPVAEAEAGYDAAIAWLRGQSRYFVREEVAEDFCRWDVFDTGEGSADG